MHWCNAEPLYFLKITEKGISDGTLTDTWGHLVLQGYNISKGAIWNPFARETFLSKNLMYCLSVIITPVEVYDTYVEKIICC